MKLRDFQEEAIEQLRLRLLSGLNRLILCAPTGAGKTVMATHMIREAASRGKKTVFLVDMVALVDQASRTLSEFGIDHGILQADNTRRTWEKTLVASEGTIRTRGWPQDVDFLVVDEAHVMRKATREYVKSRKIPVIGLTATPFSRGLGSVYDDIVSVTTTNKLVEDGWLVRPMVIAGREIDVGRLQQGSDGEWTRKSVQSQGIQIIGDVVQEWERNTFKYFGKPEKTIVFSATVPHGEEICRQFNARGYNFQQIYYKGNSSEQAETIAEFRRGNSEIHGLVSCEALTKGFDVPDIKIGVAARPYRKSITQHIQQLGRVMRPYEGKDLALWIDHTGNYMGFFHDTERFFEDGVRSLPRSNVKRREMKAAEKKRFLCPGCGALVPPAMPMCPSCGKTVRKRAMIQSVGGRFGIVGQTTDECNRGLYDQICRHCFNRTGGDKRHAYRLATKQYEVIVGQWPNRGWGWQPVPQSSLNPEICKTIERNIARFRRER